MSSTDVDTGTSTEVAELSTIDMGLEVVTVPVADVDRAKSFYESLGWRMDIDIVVNDDIRQVQMTPPPLAVLDPSRQGLHDDGARLPRQVVPDGPRHRR